MNKLVFLFLIITIISVNAFVKRDAPEAPKNDFQDTIQDIAAKLTELAGKAATESQDQIKAIIENAKKALETLKPTEAPKA